MAKRKIHKNLQDQHVVMDYQSPALKRRLRREEELNHRFIEGRDKGRTEGYVEGHKEGKQQTAEKAFSDLQNCWNQVAQFAQAASNYAAEISAMYKDMAPKKLTSSPNTALEEQRKGAPY